MEFVLKYIYYIYFFKTKNMKKQVQLLFIFLLGISFHFSFSQCSAPTSVSVSAITPNTIVVDWNQIEVDNVSWTLTIRESADIATIYTNLSSRKPYLVTDLYCNTSYDLFVTSYCNGVQSAPSETIVFQTASCIPDQFSFPIDLNACINETGTSCFNLNSNNVNLLSGTNPSNYIITYHETLTNAITDTNPLFSPYCISEGVNTIYSRIEDLNGQLTNMNLFNISAQDFANSGNLNPITQCDNNNDGIVVFDLTSIQAQVATTNQLTFYTSLVNAQNQISPIVNTTNYSVNVISQNTTIFVREDIAVGCDAIYSINLIPQGNCNLASNCANANSLCGNLGIPFLNTINIPSTGQAGCLTSAPNATWFTVPVSTSGTINLKINQGDNAPLYDNADVDYIVYGPFSSATGNCGLINNGNIVSCSYSFNSTEYPVIANAVAGQYYLLMVTNFFGAPGYIKIDMLPTSTGTINCSGMEFTAYLDSNNNGTKDTGEVNFPLGDFHYEKNSDGVVHNITSPTGKMGIYDTSNSNSYNVSFTVNPLYASLYNVNPSAFNNLSVTNGVLSQYNFPVTIVQNYNDLGVVVVPINNPRPGFNYINKIVYGNLGNQVVANGTVTFTKDAAVTIGTVSQAGVVNNAAGFTYDFTNLQPFEYRTIDVNMIVPTIPTVTAGQILVSNATIAPITGDVFPNNNTNSTSQMIINAYDPNDKTEVHGPEILHSSFSSNDYLYYTIRFENTGNASAINVRVNDVLNAMLDENTIKVESASHPYVLDRIGNNLTWKFDNIMLPVSVANTTTGKGYVTFKIKPKPGYAVGDIIPNTASIYFDFNPAIVTNMFQTEFVAVLESETFLTDEFAVYPNPTSSILNIQSKLNMTISEVNVYDLLGKQFLNKKMAVSSTEIDMTNYSPGLYLLEVISEDNQKSIHKIIKK